MEVKERNYLSLNNEVLGTIQSYVSTLAYSKFYTPIHTLQSRHIGYEVEDFIQESMQIIINDFATKTFESIGRLKRFILKAMEFHYLKEKRKYWYTHRGLATTVSLEANVSNLDNLSYGDVVSAKDEDGVVDNFNLHNILSKNLFIVVDNNKYIICKVSDLKNYKSNTILSVNNFIKTQKELGMKDTCKFYKEHGFYMTKNSFEEISTLLVDYMKDNDLLVVNTEEHKYEDHRAKASWLQ